MKKDSKHDDSALIWSVGDCRKLLHTPVFDVITQREEAANGIAGDYIAVEAPDWVMVIPEYEGGFVTVRQWRHAAEHISVEFPGGVIDAGESPETAAARELAEETGFIAGKMTKLGCVSPNPALFKNHFHVYLAEDLIPTGEQKLDDDELLSWELIPKDTLLDMFGSDDCAHALMGTALALYLRKERKTI